MMGRLLICLLAIFLRNEIKLRNRTEESRFKFGWKEEGGVIRKFNHEF